MPTYIVVDKDKSPLNPGEINAGGTIQVSEGDVFIFDSDANATTKFETASGQTTNFEIQFNGGNNNNFNVEIEDDLNADIDIASGVDISEVDIKATKAESVTLTAGDNVSLGGYEGSENGADIVTVGDNFTTDKDIKTKGGADSISLGDNATIKKIETGDGDDTITIGNGLVADDIKTGDGADELTLGDGAVVDDIDTGKGDDTVAVGDDLIADDIKTGDGADELTLGDDATIHNIDAGKGDDTVTVGDGLNANDIKTGDGADQLNIADGATLDDIDTGKGDDVVTLGKDFTGDKVETKDGDDRVTIGTGAVIDDLDGGNDYDTLYDGTGLPNVSNFENIICFVRGTSIQAPHGEIAVEQLSVGDEVVTMDHGAQKIRWIGSSVVRGRGNLAPICISENALGNNRSLWVSKQHRLLLGNWKTELYFGESEVLVPAGFLLDQPNVTSVEVDAVEYFHILFDRHEIVYSEGIPTESFHPGQCGLNSLEEQSRQELFEVFPELRSHPSCFGSSARHSLKSHESRLLAA